MRNRVPTPPTAKQSAKEPDNEHNKALVRWTRAVAIFTGLLFIANAATIYFIWKQGRVAADAQIDTREQLRAVVTQQGGLITFVRGPDRKIIAVGFLPHFQNYGGTRTAFFRSWVSVHYFDGSQPPDNLDLTKPYKKITTTDVMVGPNAQFNVGPVFLLGEDVDKLMARKGIGLIWGQAEYADIFAPDIIHTINFCLLFSEPDPPPTPQIVTPAPQPDLPGPMSALPQGREVIPTLIPYRADCNKSQ